jgi:AraC-like DNA-binding protein
MPGSATVNARGLLGLLSWAAVQGVDARAILGEAGLPPDTGIDPDARVPRAQWVEVWAAVEAALQRPTIALDLAAAIPVGAFDVIDYIATTSPTVRDGVERVAAYFHLVHDRTGIELDDRGDVVAVRYSFTGDVPHAERYSAEFTFACLVGRFRHSTEEAWRPRRVSFRHAAPADDTGPWEAFFGCPVQFGAPAAELVVPAEVFALRNKGADELLNGVLRRHAEAMVRELPAASSISDVVRTELQRRFVDGEPSIDAIARALGMSARTLQRRLAEDETTFAELLDAERRATAERFLADPRMGIGEVGFLLGFSDPSAFHRAFRRWTGSTPGDFRRAVLA